MYIARRKDFLSLFKSVVENEIKEQKRTKKEKTFKGVI